MNVSDIIQLTLAIIAGVAAILSFYNISLTRKSIKNQQIQWETTHLPIMKVIKIQDFYHDKIVRVVIENSNHVYHHVQSVNFTMDCVELSYQNNSGVITQNKKNEKVVKTTEYVGLTIDLRPKNADKVIGYIQLEIKDLIGRTLKMNTVPLIIENYSIGNLSNVRESYLTIV
ncbi:hypothetical protein CAY60_017980 [Shouchella clausii]|uniref:hypothetical protein n=1 Tax=Shouchella TaxID=2893057 RepID=UPI00055247B7|nr:MULTISPECIES: hypothetical protein [Shouchella]MBU3231017.1 hypothetical protein [Shouchella clausii]MBU3262908.1 hypothetical protein [Shouchella clausii]MBU3505373.1 hypothetical protein [Shouchella clausii]MBU3534390.1 hypothetical protein [Shouchella clausii]MBX0310028.1 hypothetical protein [Shouchella clausii]